MKKYPDKREDFLIMGEYAYEPSKIFLCVSAILREMSVYGIIIKDLPKGIGKEWIT